jgi:hypothetical protein
MWRAKDPGKNGIYAEEGETPQELKEQCKMVNGQSAMINEKKERMLHRHFCRQAGIADEISGFAPINKGVTFLTSMVNFQ